MLKINIHTTSIIGTEKVILRTVSAHTYVHVITTNGKKTEKANKFEKIILHSKCF